jgi:hypothetical protein
MPTLPFLVGNELRAVFPIFAGALAMILVSMMVERAFRESVAFVGYAVGSVTIGATAFGHDFAHRTLLATLAQPVSRRQIWKARMLTLFTMILSLTVLAAWPLGLYRLLTSLIFDVPNRYASVSSVLLLVAFFSSVCIAPCLTLLCRSALAGTVFTICAIFMLLYGGDGGEYVWGLTILETTGRPGFLWFLAMAFTGACIAGFISTRVLWERFQVVDARAVSLNLGNWHGMRAGTRPTAAAARRRSPWLQLALKELRLQWLAIIPVIGMCATAASFYKTPTRGGIEMFVYTIGFWSMFLCLILGAVGSAEERQLGLSDSQALLPISKTAQWLIKVALLLLLASAFAVCLPLALLIGTTGRADLPIPEPKSWQISAISVVALALYVSSCCRTTMKAVLVSLPLAGLVLALIDLVRLNEERLLAIPGPTMYQIANGMAFSYPLTGDGSIAAFTLLAPYLFGAIMIGLLLLFGCRNHFSAERSRGQLGRQLLWLVGMFTLAFVGSLSLYIRATS